MVTERLDEACRRGGTTQLTVSRPGDSNESTGPVVATGMDSRHRRYSLQTQLRSVSGGDSTAELSNHDSRRLTKSTAVLPMAFDLTDA